MEVVTYQVHVQLLGLVPGRLTIHALVHLDSELAASRSISVRGGECGVNLRAPHDEALLLREEIHVHHAAFSLIGHGV